MKIQTTPEILNKLYRQLNSIADRIEEDSINVHTGEARFTNPPAQLVRKITITFNLLGGKGYEKE